MCFFFVFLIKLKFLFTTRRLILIAIMKCWKFEYDIDYKFCYVFIIFNKANSIHFLDDFIPANSDGDTTGLLVGCNERTILFGM